MVDPASAIAACTLAFNGIKKAVSVGKEISQLGTDLSRFGKAVSDLDYLGNKAKNPPLWRKVQPGFDTSAVEIWAAQQKAKEMREELKNYISLYYGPSAWKSIVNIEAEQRKLQKEMVYKRQEKIDHITDDQIYGQSVIWSPILRSKGVTIYQVLIEINI